MLSSSASACLWRPRHSTYGDIIRGSTKKPGAGYARSRSAGSLSRDGYTEDGNVAQAQAVSDPKLLFPAALQAVMKWRYEPTYLDGMPVSIQMQVQIVFHLRH